ncbi:MAG: hypothetical protein KIT58_02195 [Planctomycetota bacterium]|nr:hypothetical protein [Planctomycetota bacterium]
MAKKTPTPPDENDKPDPLSVVVDDLRYTLDAPPRRSGKKNVVTVALDGSTETTPPLVDRCDLFAFRSRRALAQLVADVYGREQGQVLGALALLLDQAERMAQLDGRPAPERLSDERRKAAEQLLAQKDLLDRAAAAMEQLGHVGEEHVKRLAYLVATSRLMTSPLSLLLLAPSGTGKSAVLDAVTALMPSESVVTLARLTPQALFYSGNNALMHKLVIVDEYEGQADADHAVRVLQSRGELRQSVTIRGKAEEVVAKGPVAVMSGTTLSDLDPQNTSRCIELALDDSLEQTRRVQAAQAAAWSGARKATLSIQVWHDAQRLLGEEPPVHVVIPYAAKLTFPARTTADRRASAKLLGLVASHALLYSRQRERDREGHVVATVADYATVHALVQPALDAAALDLSPRAARVLRWMTEEGEATDRREVASAMGWSYNTAKKALAELAAQELVRVVEPGPPARYRLLGPRGVLGGTAELTPPASLTPGRTR